MTKEEQHRIDHLANLGEGYRCISRKLSLPENTVKSYLRRRKEPDTGICPYCGKVMKSLPHHRQKKFCSDACRLRWWKENRALMNTPGMKRYLCRTCGAEFHSYAANPRYCSRACYYDALRKEALK